MPYRRVQPWMFEEFEGFEGFEGGANSLNRFMWAKFRTFPTSQEVICNFDAFALGTSGEVPCLIMDFSIDLWRGRIYIGLA